jgi:hypothetical protein
MLRIVLRDASSGVVAFLNYEGELADLPLTLESALAENQLAWKVDKFQKKR